MGKFVAMLIVTGWASGSLDPTFASAQTEPAVKPGVVFVVGGIDFMGHAAQWALPHAGVAHEVRAFVWTHGKGRFLKDLQDGSHLVGKATELAGEVRKLQGEDPERPIYLVGHSAGAGLVLTAAELLDPATVERVVLLSAAVAPNYDLSRALRATRKGIVSFSSELDCLILGWGTSRFGTVDRMFCPAAGMKGFVMPANLGQEDQELYRSLIQITWKPGMIFEGFGGLHVCTSTPGFLARQVAPWLRP